MSLTCISPDGLQGATPQAAIEVYRNPSAQQYTSE